MELSVAIVVFLLKVGIKQLDEDYEIKSFFEDIIGAFGEKAGKKIAKMLLDSKEGINFALTDKNLVKLGIPILRISEVRENVKAILKHTQINQEMLIEYNCNSNEIMNRIVEESADKVGIKNDEVARKDVQKVIFQIVENEIKIAKEEKGFIDEILISIKKTIESNTADIRFIRQITYDGYLDTKYIRQISEENNKLLKSICEYQCQNKDDDDSWSKREEPVQKQTVDIEAVVRLVEIDSEEVK